MTALLGSSIALGSRLLRNRVVAGPMERNYGTTGGRLTDHYVEHLSRIAHGGSALVYTEASFVRADGKARVRQLGVDDDEAVPDLARLADRVHAEGALLGVQLVHAGRLARARVSGYACVAPSAVRCEAIDGDPPLELDVDDIRDLAGRFADAARRCAEAGVDVVSVHAAHGYLVSQFMSPLTNRREDEYADGARFLGEVLDAVREAATDLVVGARVSAFEGNDGGLDPAATLALLERAGAGGLDFVDVSAGNYEAPQWIVQPGEFPRGLLAPWAAGLRPLGPPLGVAGRITDGATAEKILERGDADFVTLTRALHADPDWTTATLTGSAPRPCVACNYCADSLPLEEPVPCAMNAGVLPDVPADGPAHASLLRSRRSVLIVGGGPAGMEVARRLADAGAAVRLVDRAQRLGGQFRLAAQLHEYPEYQAGIDWFERELRRLGVQVVTGVHLLADDVADAPEGEVVLATGRRGHIPDVPGSASPRVVEIRSWLSRLSTGAGGRAPEPLEPCYVVWGADREGTAVADHLAHHGVHVILVGAQDEPAADVGGRAKILLLPRVIASPRIELHLSTVLEAIHEDTLVVRTGSTGKRLLRAEGPVLVSQGLHGSATIGSSLRRAVGDRGLYIVGDAAGRGGSAAEALADGARLATRLLAQREPTASKPRYCL